MPDLVPRNRWFLLSLTLQIVVGALVLAFAFGHGIALGSAAIPVLLLAFSVGLGGAAWHWLTAHRDADYEALLRYVRQRADDPLTAIPAFADPALHKVAVAISTYTAAADDTVSVATPQEHPLVDTLSQEMRTPISAMLGALALLADTSLDIEQKALLSNVRHSAQEVWGTVRDVFDYSELRAGRVQREVITFDPAALVTRVVEYWTPLARERAIELASFIDPGVPARVEGDAAHIEQVVSGLLRGAIAATRAGGAVVSLRLGEDTGLLRFEVSDSGDGLSDDARALWAADLRGDNLVADGYVDIGLPLARRTVELLGGELVYDTRPADGTRFSFTLALPDAGAAPEAWLARRAPLEGARCLLVDDNRSSLAAIREQLHAWNVNVDTVEDGARAVRVLQDALQRDQPYDLAIVDLTLPDLDGMELANRIRAIKDFSTLTLVSMVGDRDAGAPMQLRDKGFDAFLVKPVRQQSMAHWLVEALQRQKVNLRDGAARSGGGVLEGTRVLLVEDSPANRMVASAMLSKAGYQVETAEDGAQALEQARHEDWGLILMDLQMPVMDGITATREIRRLAGPRGQVPIVAVTANVFPEDLQACAEVGMAEVVPKPIKRDDLLAAVARWVRYDDPGEGMIDRTTLADLIERLGEAGTARVLRVFLDESARRIRRIGENLSQPEARSAEVDKLRQAASGFGIRGLEQACAALPKDLDAGAVEALQVTLERVRAVLVTRLGQALA